jgi:hypothetical protein
MAIVFEAFDDDPLCFGHTWLISDEHSLARYVALLILGYHLHVQMILDGAAIDLPSPSRALIDRLVEFLNIPSGASALRWHRDGWLFQMISWIAANRTRAPNHLLRAPQPRPADKGFDGIILELPTGTGGIGAVILCEDKASDNPRSTIRDEVWPSIRTLEDGQRNAEIVSEMSSLLLNRVDQATAVALIHDVCWSEVRRYRLTLTVPTPHETSSLRNALFDGYNECASGPIKRRQAEIVCMPELRNWMDGFSTKVRESLLKQAEAEGV